MAFVGALPGVVGASAKKGDRLSDAPKVFARAPVRNLVMASAVAAGIWIALALKSN
jgi:hypothetical protein